MSPTPPTKPTQAPPSPHAPQQSPSHATTPAIPLVLKGPTFANILGAMPMTKTPIVSPTTAQGAKMQTALPQAVTAVHPDTDKRRRHEGADDLDPSARQAAQLAPPIGIAPPTEAEKEQVAAQTNARVSLEDLVPQLVKKIAWSGDGQRGTVRMELGAGELAGSTLTVSAANGRVSVDVAAPPGTDVAAWRERLSSRLAARGLALDTIEVH